MIKFAGVHSLLPSPAVVAYIDALLSKVFVGPTHGGPLGGASPMFSEMNWTTHFPPKLNTLTWPTGASRWASMYLLVDSERLGTINNATHASNAGTWLAAPGQLQIADSRFVGTIAADDWSLGTGEAAKMVALSTEMYALDPRPISLPYTWVPGEEEEDPGSWEPTTEKTVWLLPIVDERWFWQWKHVSPAWSTWNAALDGCADALTSENETDEVHEDYGDPPSLGDSERANAAKLLDDLAWSVGQRVVRRFSGGLRTVTATNAASEWDSNTTNALGGTPAAEFWHRVSGGEWGSVGASPPPYKAAATIPEKVMFHYGGSSTEIATQDAGATEWASGTSMHVSLPWSPDPASDYALQWVTDWVLWQKRRADQAYAGVKAWNPTGFEDYIQITHGSRDAAPWNAVTRIVTHPLGSPAPLRQPLSSGGCTQRYSLGIYNNPSSGSVSIAVTLNTVTESIVLDYDFTATEIKDAIDAHSEFVAESVGCDVETGSDWPHGIMLVTLPAGATMSRAGETLVRRTGGYVPEFRVDLCCS